MKTIEIKGWIFAAPKGSWEGKGLSYEFSTSDYEKWAKQGDPHFSKYVKVAEHTIVCEVRDDVDPTASMIRALEAQKEAARKEFNERVAHINNQIRDLQALTFNAA